MRKRRDACSRIAGVAVGVMSEILVGSITEASDGDRPVAVLRRRHRRRDRRQRRRALGRGLLRDARQDGPVGQHRDRLERADRAVRRARARAAARSSSGRIPMALVFNGFELGALLLAVLIANQVTHEGESTWFEGLQLLAVYVVLGLTFFFVVTSCVPCGLARCWPCWSRVGRLLWVDLHFFARGREPTLPRGRRLERSAGSWCRCSPASSCWLLDDGPTTRSPTRPSTSSSARSRSTTCSSSCCCSATSACPSEYRARLLFWGIVGGAGAARRWRSSAASR